MVARWGETGVATEPGANVKAAEKAHIEYNSPGAVTKRLAEQQLKAAQMGVTIAQNTTASDIAKNKGPSALELVTGAHQRVTVAQKALEEVGILTICLINRQVD